MGTQRFKQARFAQAVAAGFLLLGGFVLQTAPVVSQQQQGNPSKEGETITRLNTELVSLTVSVTDSRDRATPGLERQHFEVFEDEIKQTVEYFANDDLPISIGIIFDLSGSMSGDLDNSRRALAAFVQTSHADDDFFLIGFNQHPNLLAAFANGDALLSKLSLINAGGATALYDAVYLGLEKVKQGRHRKRALLVISDGLENSSRYTRKELRQLIKETDVHIYCVRVIGSAEGDDGAGLLGHWNLEDLSEGTGGKAYFPRSEAELEEITPRIALELRRQYSIGYVPTNSQRDGKWRRVKVKVNPPRGLSKLNVRAKDGYYAAR